MFGYLTVNLSALDEEETAIYRSHYCGICARLRELAGLKGAFALQYDLVFLSLLLSSLYEPEETWGKTDCPRHPFRGVEARRSEVIDYAGDVGIVLTFLKLRDDVADDGSLSARVLSSALEKAYEACSARMPDLVRGIGEDMEELTKSEREGSRDADRLMNLFGDIMGRIFCCGRTDLFASYLYDFGMALGRYLYLLDACCDLEKDKKKGSFNPLAGTPHERAEWQREALGLELEAVSRIYDMLPVVRDRSILDNIVYSGIASAVPKAGEEDGA